MSNELKKELWDNITEQGFVMVGLSQTDQHSEPMHAHVDKSKPHSLWIYTTKDNRVATGGKSMIQFVSKGHDLFACMLGQLSEESDTSLIDKFWSSGVEAWYENGKEDDSLLMMRFDLNNAEIWTQDASITGKIKLATGATVEPEDLGEHAVV
ncbi:MAG: pyridoxamine 5'-phosphate oxidase family protein [Paraglaciecola sp.]|uniref:pyridoxamine 5'-phosphate oxidase family protein n=1 Tax=Paraglaciecola sp. TaxID=1920173 RepID=UPI00273DF790|nr:pyridoxamine 5'-phosphate oxidase family protein [Paraglaciecola sp.]MDP5031568.1 pyridoxamine 5'-phosphate oxidase family protein [Paraglaciecola sp.]MDP5132527.1 pyridoxamine 5'-phosphate oxidase family protein [Paraglaciecola sp.]